VGVDLGGTKVLAELVDATGRVLAREQRATAVAAGFDGVLAEIATAVSACLAPAEGARILGVGVGVAGQVVAETGVVSYAPNLYWRNTPLRARLEHELELPVAVLNDVRAATWGEWRYGAGHGADDLVVVFVGTGIGGGVVSGGRLLTGCTNMAGELGHMTVVAGGRQCRCGNLGCMEAYAGGWAIAQRAQEAVEASPEAGAALKARAGSVAAITAETVHEVWRDGDPLAARLVDETVDYLGAGLVGVVNGFNPCMLVLGGGIVHNEPQYVDRVGRIVRAGALAAGVAGLQVVPASLGSDAGAIGAAAFARAWLLEEQKGES